MSKEYKLVPVEPTPEMLYAGRSAIGFLWIYKAMLEAAPQPPALGGEHQSKLLKLAANLANRRPLRPLQDLCERQSSIKTSRLIEYVEMCGDTLAAIALDIRNHTDACRAPLLAEIASERELRRELGVRVHQLKDELKDVAQLKAEIERLKSEAEENHKEREVICANYDQLKARNAELEGLLREVVALDPRGEFMGWQLDGRISASLSKP